MIFKFQEWKKVCWVVCVLLSGKSLHKEIVLADTGKTQTSFDVALFPRRPVVGKEEGPRQRKMIKATHFPTSRYLTL